MRAHYRVGWLVTALALLALLTSAGKLPTNWMLPSGQIKVKSAIYAKGSPKFCALTFDDGPNSTYMPKIQRTLDEQGVKATFFLIGRLVPSNAKAVKSLAASGHELANHSYSHPEMQKLSETQQRQQISKCQAAIEKLGLEARWFRPPYGTFNRTTVKTASAQHLETVLWSTDPQDWAKPGAERIRNRVLRGTGNGAIVLLHCTNAQTVEALPGIIKHLKDQGYHFLTLSEWRTAAVTGTIPTPAVKQPRAAANTTSPAADTGKPVTPDPAGTSAAQAQAEPNMTLDADAAALHELPGDSVTEGEGAQTVVTDNGGQVDHTAVAKETSELQADPGAKLKFSPLSVVHSKPQSAATATPLPAVASKDEVIVWANFTGPDGAWDIWHSERGGKLHRIKSTIAPLQGVGPSGEVVDTTLTPGVDVPLLPDQAGPETTPGGELVATTREEPVTAAEEQPAADTRPAVSLPPLEQRKPLDFRIIDLVDFHNSLTEWKAPATINPEMLSDAAQLGADGMYAGPQFYFLSLAPDIEDYTWVELETTVRLGKLSGVVLASEFVTCGPTCDLPYPWAFYRFDSLDRAAMVDLTTENSADVMDIIAKGKPHVFIIVRPQYLNFFISAHTLAEMKGNLRDFILLRQATAGLPYDPAPVLSDYWQLPEGVHIGRFTDGKRTVLVLYTHDYLKHTVQIPAEYAYYSQVTVDAGGWLRIARLESETVTVDATPVVLYYEYQVQ